ncbi:autotransporter outer membrane beta-barrel domain-containing protein [Brucella intermedia]
MSLHRFVFREGTLSVGKTHFIGQLKRSSRFFMASVAATAICIATPSIVQANDWTGAVSDDFFDPFNWDDNNGPQGSGSTVNNGNAVGTIDLGSPVGYNSNLADRIGTIAGQTGSVTINVLPNAESPTSSTYLNTGNELEVGANGGRGTLTLSLEGPIVTTLGANAISIGKGTGSIGEVNLVGTGKDTGVPPEGPLWLDTSCQGCAPVFVSSSLFGGLYIGVDGGAGTLNLDGAAFTTYDRGEFIVGDGAGSNGAVNILAGGKLGDPGVNYNSSNINTLTKGKATVGFDGGTGAITLDGSAAATRNDVPMAFFGQGLVIGNGQNSVGSVNILSGGKVHSYTDYQIGVIYQNYVDRSALDTNVGINGGTGSITVSGTNSVWYQSGILQDYLSPWNNSTTSTDTGALRVGQSGTGELTIADNGEVRIGTATFLAETDDSGGVYKQLYSLVDHVSNGTLILGGETTGNGTLSIGGSVGGAAVAPGRLMAQTVEFGEGTGLIRFNHTSDNYIFDQFDAQYLDGPSRPSTLAIVGDGTIEAAAGRTILNENQLSFTGTLLPNTGILQINGDISTATANILAGGTLEGTGVVGSTLNTGTVAPGQTPGGSQGLASSIGTLTIAGNYTGQGGILSLDTVLGNDSSLTDKLAILGDTSGNTTVKVKNINGNGDDTIEGIQIVTVGGTSDPNAFSLAGDYVFNGQQAVVGGAYAYRLFQGSTSQPGDGNWYLRSNRIPTDPVDPDIPVDPDEPNQPIYQPGVSLYETYPQFLLGLNSLPTLQQRTGNRYWSNAGNVMLSEGADPAGAPYAPASEAGNLIEGRGIWGRIEGAHSKIDPKFSTSGENYDYNIFKLQAGLDGMLLENGAGKLIGGFTVHYTHGKAKTYSIFGDDEVSTDGYGFGGTLTWYGDNGFYVDGQAQLTWYDSDLSANDSEFTAGLDGLSLADSNNGFGFAISGETGQRVTLDQNWSITPQAQLTYSKVDFDSFNDVFGARISLDRGESLQGRLGLAVEHQNSWYNANGLIDRAQVYGIANLYYEFLEGTKVDVSGTTFANQNERLWGGIGLGGSYNWNSDKYSVYGEGAINTSLADFGDSYSYKGTLGFRVKW